MKEKQAKTAKKRAIRGPVIHPVETSKTTPLKKELTRGTTTEPKHMDLRHLTVAGMILRGFCCT